MKKFLSVLSISLVFSAGQALADNVTVVAFANSTSGGAGVSALNLTAGQSVTVSVNPNDLWNAGALPRWSNANGLNTNLFYSSGMDSQVGNLSVGTQIGSDLVLTLKVVFQPHTAV